MHACARAYESDATSGAPVGTLPLFLLLLLPAAADCTARRACARERSSVGGLQRRAREHQPLAAAGAACGGINMVSWCQL